MALPKITFPTFHGDLMSWASFWSQFKSAVDSNTDLTPLNKLAYLREAVKDQTTRSLFFSGAETDWLYHEVVTLLHERFDRRREVHSQYCKDILENIKNSKSEINQLTDTLTRAVSGLKHTKQFDAEAILTSIVVPTLPKNLKVDWEVHTKDQTDVPPIEELIKFLRFRARRTHLTPIETSNRSLERKNLLIQQDTEVLCMSQHHQPTLSSMSAYSVLRRNILCTPAPNSIPSQPASAWNI